MSPGIRHVPSPKVMKVGGGGGGGGAGVVIVGDDTTVGEDDVGDELVSPVLAVCPPDEHLTTRRATAMAPTTRWFMVSPFPACRRDSALTTQPPARAPRPALSIASVLS